MSSRAPHVLIALAALLVPIATLHNPLGATAVDGPADLLTLADQARQHSQESEWAEAAAAYAQLTAANPYDAAYWNGLAYAAHQLKRFDQAIPAFEKARDLGFNPATCDYNICCGYALLGQSDRALDHLQRALDAGFSDYETLQNDGEIDSLRSLPRYRALVGVPPQNLDRTQAWQFDLDFFQRRMAQVHYSLYGVVSRERFTQELTELKQDVPRLSDQQVWIRLQKILALVGDGHTDLHPPPGGSSLHILPLHFYEFTDGLFVLGAPADQADLVGLRVEQVGDQPITDVLKKLEALCSVDNPMGYRAWAPVYLKLTEALADAGATTDLTQVQLILREPSGSSRVARVAASTRPPPMGSAADILARPDWVYMNRDATAPLPLYLSQLRELHWYQHVPEQRMIYAQINAIQNSPRQTLAEFARKLNEQVEATESDFLVIDLRFNGGGNNFLNKPLIHALVRCPRVNQRGHLFVITSRHTFSAAMNCAADLEMHTEALFVGEPTGSKPNFVGETTPITLPCSGWALSCSSLYWQRSHAFDHRIWIAPDLPAEFSSADFRENRDPALEAILSYLRASNGAAAATR